MLKYLVLIYLSVLHILPRGKNGNTHCITILLLNEIKEIIFWGEGSHTKVHLHSPSAFFSVALTVHLLFLVTEKTEIDCTP